MPVFASYTTCSVDTSELPGLGEPVTGLGLVEFVEFVITGPGDVPLGGTSHLGGASVPGQSPGRPVDVVGGTLPSGHLQFVEFVITGPGDVPLGGMPPGIGAPPKKAAAP